MNRFIQNTIIGGIFFLIPVVVATAILGKALKMMRSIKDLLLLNLSPGNVPVSVNGSAWELPGTEARGVTVSTAEGTLSSQFAANTNNSLQLLFASYQFPAGDHLRFTVNSGFVNRGGGGGFFNR